MTSENTSEQTADRQVDARTAEWLRAAIQDAHLSFLIGAGTPSRFFSMLGDIETTLTRVDRLAEPGDARDIARASVQGLFFDTVIWPNVRLVAGAPDAQPVLLSYARFGQAMNRLLIARRSSLLGKQVSLFTTNVDLAFEVAFERLGIALNDGFSGRFRPVYDPGAFGTARFRSSRQYGHRSEVPTFDLYKLHGSVGWCSPPGEATPPEILFDRDLLTVHAVKETLDEVRGELISVGDPTELNPASIVEAAQGRSGSAKLQRFLDAYKQLVIVNPEKQKFETTVLTEIYYELIRHFANTLERENSVLFVHGFSFRDEHLRKIVLRAARTNPTLQVVVFCFSREDQQRYECLIPVLHVPNANVRYIAPTDGGGMLDLDAIVDNYLLPLSDTLPERPDIAADTFRLAEDSQVHA